VSLCSVPLTLHNSEMPSNALIYLTSSGHKGTQTSSSFRGSRWQSLFIYHVYFFFSVLPLPKCEAWSFINSGRHLATWSPKKKEDKWIQNRLEILINRMAAANQNERFSRGDNNRKKEPINIIISIASHDLLSFPDQVWIILEELLPKNVNEMV